MNRRRPSFTLLPAESAGDNELAEVQARAPSTNQKEPAGPIKRPRRSSFAPEVDLAQASNQSPGQNGSEFMLPKSRQRKRHRRKGRQSDADLNHLEQTLETERVVNARDAQQGVAGVTKQTGDESWDPTPRSILDLLSESAPEQDPTEASFQENGAYHLQGLSQGWPNPPGFEVPGLILPSSPVYDGEVTHALVPNAPRESGELSIDLRTAAEKAEDLPIEEDERGEEPSDLPGADEAVGQSSSRLQSVADIRQRPAASPSESSLTLPDVSTMAADVTPVKGALVPVFSPSLMRKQSSGLERTRSKLLKYGSVSTPDGGGRDSTATTPRRGLETPNSPFSPSWLEKKEQELLSPVDLSIRGYLAGEVASGSTLRNSAVSGGDERRERVYNTMFHVPWRAELLIDVGFLVCLDSFLSLFTIMPYRLGVFFWRLAVKSGLKQRPRADELCDLACILVLALGTIVLHSVDISFIYHWIRGQAIIKLYVVFNVLEIMDKLLQSFGADVLQVLFNTAGRVSICLPERLPAETIRLLLDQGVATACYVVHSLIIMSQAVTLNVAINSHNNALLTLLISNNFVEIKGNVFKRLGKENLHKLAYLDTVERFHIMAHLLFVLVQNVLTSEEPWAVDLALNALMIVMCEVLVDVIKHAFLAKFNEVKPAVYGGFLQSLCWQTVQSGSHQVHKTLSFVPLAPACVVVRVVSPLLWKILPAGPRWLTALLVLLISVCSIAVLTLVKVGLGLGLQLHARWYLNRCIQKGRAHPHQD